MMIKLIKHTSGSKFPHNHLPVVWEGREGVVDGYDQSEIGNIGTSILVLAVEPSSVPFTYTLTVVSSIDTTTKYHCPVESTELPVALALFTPSQEEDDSFPEGSIPIPKYTLQFSWLSLLG